MNLPNRISIFRILLVPVFIFLYFHYMTNYNGIINMHFYLVLGVLALAAFTDALDGFIARVFKQKTTLGSVLDPLADKLLLTSCFIMLAIFNKIPFWVMLVVVARDIILSIGWVVRYVFSSIVSVKPVIAGKVSTFLQLCAIFLSIINYNARVIRPVTYAMVLFTLLSGLIYIYQGSKSLNNE